MSRRGPLAAFLSFGVFWGGWAALLPAVQTAVGASKGALGLALLFTGRALDRRGHRLLPWLLTAFAAAAILPSFADSPAALALALLALGAASGAVDVGINGAVAELEASRGARLMHLAHALFSGGVLLGALGAGLARELGAGRTEVLGGLAVVLLVVGALNLGQPRSALQPKRPDRPRLSRAAIPFGVACAAAFVIEGGMENWGAVFLERDLDAGPAVSALAPAAYGGAMMLGRFSGQWLERRVGDAVLFGGSLCVALLGLVAAALAPNVPVAVAAFFVGGVGISIAAPTLFGAAGRSGDPGERGVAVATATTIGYLGFLVGPPLVGGLAELVGLRAAFAALAVIAAALAAATPRLGLGREPA